MSQALVYFFDEIQYNPDTDKKSGVCNVKGCKEPMVKGSGRTTTSNFIKHVRNHHNPE